MNRLHHLTVFVWAGILFIGAFLFMNYVYEQRAPKIIRQIENIVELKGQTIDNLFCVSTNALIAVERNSF